MTQIITSHTNLLMKRLNIYKLFIICLITCSAISYSHENNRDVEFPGISNPVHSFSNDIYLPDAPKCEIHPKLFLVNWIPFLILPIGIIYEFVKKAQKSDFLFSPPKTHGSLDWWCPVNIHCDPCYIERCIKQLSWVYLWTEGSVCDFLFCLRPSLPTSAKPFLSF